MKDLVVNLSRLDPKGGGLLRFSRNILKCLELNKLNFTILAPRNLIQEGSQKISYVPKWLSINSNISRFKPILWLIYSILFLPKSDPTISTTHHGVPGAKNQVITIHDVRPYYLPDSFAQRFYFKYILPKLAKNAVGILTVSNASKNQIREIYEIESNKIFVVPNFVNTSQFFPSRVSKVDPPYLLMVGATWKHKNAHELIQCADLWSQDYRLKIISGKNEYQNELRKTVGRIGMESKVDFISSVNDSELLSLYQNSSALVYPSYMEGFGIPPLEAMACGVPTIVSNIDVFRELYSDVPIYVELGNFYSWEGAIKSLKNQVLINEKIKKGLLKVQEFSLERMCTSLASAIDSIWPEIRKN